MTIDDVITGILQREGGYVDDPADRGGATNLGITAATLGMYRGLNRPATRDEVRKLTEPEARAIYYKQFVIDPGFEVLPEWLLGPVVDDGVLSGPTTAVKTLQTVLGVSADGRLGPKTRAALDAIPEEQRGRVIRRLVVARALRYARIVEKDPTQARFIEGWLTRAFSFLEAA